VHQSSPSASGFIAEHDVIWYGMAVRQVQVSCPSYVLSQALAQPTGLCREKGWRDSLDAAQALLSNSQNIGVLSANTVVATNARHSIIRAAVKKGNSTLLRKGMCR